MTTFDSELARRTSADAGDILGAILSAFDKDGKSLYQKTFGRMALDSTQLVTENAGLWVFSVTKLLTTICTLQCVERSLISLDDAVEEILPELKNPEIVTLDKETDKVSLAPANAKITLRQLLTHTSGVGYDGLEPSLIAWRASRGEEPYSFSNNVIKAFSIPLLFEPGEGWAYGGGVDWAGEIVERLSGLSLSQYMAKHLFQPLGMTRTTFYINELPGLADSMLAMSHKGSDGKLSPFRCPLPEQPESDSGGMGLISTVPDICKVLQDILSDQPTLLQPASLAEMFTPQFSPKSPQAESLLKYQYMYGDIVGPGDHTGNLSFGLGGLINVKETAIHPAGTMSWVGMVGHCWFLNKQEGVGGMYSEQMFPGGDGKTPNEIVNFISEIWRLSKS